MHTRLHLRVGSQPPHTCNACCRFWPPQDVVVGPDGMLLVRFAPYYEAVPRLLPYLGDDPQLGDLLAGLEAAGLKVATLQPQAWLDEQPELQLPQDCTAATVPLFKPLPASAQCLCGHLEVGGGRLPGGSRQGC